MCSNSSKFKFLLKFTKNSQVDDVIEGSWRHQRNFKHSLLHLPIDDLSDLGSEEASSFNLLEIKKSPIGALTDVEPWKKWHLQPQLFLWRSRFLKHFKYAVWILKQFPKHIRIDIVGYYTTYMYQSSFKSCYFCKNYKQNVQVDDVI